MSSAAQHPFRFGVQLCIAASSVAWKEQVRKAELAGYDVLLLADHFGTCFAYGPALTMAAAATTRLRFGTLVLQNPLRHPALVAMEAATIDVLSDGRFELGLGAGGSLMSDYERSGIPFASPRTRVGQLEESVRIIKSLFRGEPVSFAGRHYRLIDFQNVPNPLQQPALPLLIGAGGPRLLRFAAQEADIVSILPQMLPQGGDFHLEEFTVEAYRHKLALMRAAAGERVIQIELNTLVQRLVVTDHPYQDAERVSQRWRISPEDVLDSPYALIGSIEQIVEAMQRRREQLGLSYYVVFERDLETFAPIVARLAGR